MTMLVNKIFLQNPLRETEEIQTIIIFTFKTIVIQSKSMQFPKYAI